ncbi:serine-rich adhesin for platelets-like [Oncorhynchus mykiss]|uniref:serine-rich adhesin for platelets-like n=1 Tax=Oncorhynchus mykiss TaxID=8022 RepID=UPI001877FC16|nr:serine-rich adhesin for platelets-like [Oncorhynchus mykiss]
MSYNRPGSQSSLKGSYRKRTWMLSRRQHNSDTVDNITSEVLNNVTDINEEANNDSGDDSSRSSRSSRSSSSSSSSSSRSSRSSSSSSSSSRSSSSSSSSSVSIHNHNADKDGCQSSVTKHVIQKVSSRIKHSVPIKLKSTKVSGLKQDPVSDPSVYNDPEHQYTEDDVCSGAVYTLPNPPKTDDTEPESAPSEATSAETQSKQPETAAETQSKQPETAAETQPKQPDSAAETQSEQPETAAETQPKQPDTAAEIQTPEIDTGETQTPELDTVAEIQTPETESAADIQTLETESAAEIQTRETESAAEIQTPETESAAENQTPEPESAAEIQTPEPDTVAENQTPETGSAAEIQTRETESAAEIQTPETESAADIQTRETDTVAEIQTPEPDTVAENQTPETGSADEIQTQETGSAAEIQTPETESVADIQTRETDTVAEIQTPETAYTIPNPQSTAEPGSQRLGEPCEMSCNVPECRVDNGILLAVPGYQDRAEDAVSATEDLTRSVCANSKGTESALDSIAKGYRCDRSDDEVDAALDIITCVTYVRLPGITHVVLLWKLNVLALGRDVTYVLCLSFFCYRATENESALDDMLSDVEYVNAFPECDMSHFYDSEPHFSRPQWNVNPCPGLIVSATTDPSSSIIPHSSSSICNVVTQPKDVSVNDDCIGDMPYPGYPGNSMFALDRACCDYIFKQQSALQLDPHLVEVHQDHDPHVSTPRQEDAVVLDPEQPISQVPYTPQPTVDIHGLDVYKLKPVTALQSQRSLFPTPPQSEAAVTYEELVPDPSLQNLDSDGDQVLSIAMITPLMKQLIICSTCTRTFNRAVICNTYLIQLNRPIQCACGCVLCTLCYSEHGGCSRHNMSSTRAPVSTTASTLANCPALEHLGAWDLELNKGDVFKTDNEVNVHVQLLMNKEQSPDMDTLRPGRYITISRSLYVNFLYYYYD